MSRHIGELHEKPERYIDCGSCYGNGCIACGMKGRIETPEAREDREAWEDGAYDRDRDDRITGTGRYAPHDED